MIETRNLEIPKECDDVLKLVVEIVKIVKNKGDYTTLIDELIAAIDGAADIPAEAKNIKALSTAAGHRIGEIVEIFLAEK